MLVLIACVAQHVHAQAYCALRDPVTAIYDLYPEGTHHRSIIRTVDVNHRAEVSDQLPFTIHFDELGRHTLYVVADDRGPLGLVHVRSERGRYGLTEIAWALDVDSVIKRVAIQRARDQDVRAAVDALSSRLQNADLAAIQRMLKETGWSDAERVVLRSAAKTAAVTPIVWREDLLPLQAMDRASRMWPDAPLSLRPSPLPDGGTSVVPLEDLHVWAVDVKDQGPAIIAHATLGEPDRTRELWVVVDASDARLAEVWERGRLVPIGVQDELASVALRRLTATAQEARARATHE